MFVGITGAFFYMQILEYRKVDSDEERKRRFPILDKFHRSSIIQAIMFVLSVGLVWNSLLIGHSAIAHP